MINTKTSSQVQQLIAAVSKTYDIGECNYCEPLAGGLLNRVYLLRASHGQFILKEHRYRDNESKLQLLRSLLDHLNSNNVSCDYFIPTRNRGFFFEYEGSIYAVHRFLEGTNYARLSQLNAKQRTNAIIFLAEYHSAVWGLRLQGENVKPRDLPVVFTDDIRWIRDYISNHQNIFDSERDYKFVMAQTDKSEVYVSSDCYQPLPRLFVHGDYRFCNVVFTENKVSGIFDWDLLQYAPRVFEVVDACDNFALGVQDAGESVDFTDRFADFTRLFSMYQSVARDKNFDLSAQEIAAVPEMFRLKLLQTGVNFSILLRQLPLRPGESYDERIDRSHQCLNDALNTLRNIDSSIL